MKTPVKFEAKELTQLFRPHKLSNGEDNGQITIIGGSDLFHGAPLFALIAASRVVDMVFFSSPAPSVGEVAAQLKSRLNSFIWVPWIETDSYIAKSDAVLIGPGFMRFKSEDMPHHVRNHSCDATCQETRKITYTFLSKFPDKKWVIDAGSLQVMDPDWLPKDSVITPNKKEYAHLFGDMDPQAAAETYHCYIAIKGPVTMVYGSGETPVAVYGGNAGMTKGGTGDVMAGLTTALLAKNDPFLALKASSFITKKAGDDLYTQKKEFFNADDLALQIPTTLSQLLL